MIKTYTLYIQLVHHKKGRYTTAVQHLVIQYETQLYVRIYVLYTITMQVSVSHMYERSLFIGTHT